MKAQLDGRYRWHVAGQERPGPIEITSQQSRFTTDRVQITRSPNGDLILHPCQAQRGQALLDTLAGFEPSFVASLEAQQASPNPVQERESL